MTESVARPLSWLLVLTAGVASLCLIGLDVLVASVFLLILGLGHWHDANPDPQDVGPRRCPPRWWRFSWRSP